MTEAELQAIMKGIAPVLKETIHKQVQAAIHEVGTDALADVIAESVKAVIAPVLVRIKALETAPKSLDYQGVWQRAVGYRRNQGATHKGSLWMCLEDGRGIEPGSAPAVWQLAQKEDAP
jgi:hypothetical protein